MAWGWLKKAGRGIWSGVKFLAPFLVSAGLAKIKKKNPKYAWLIDAIDLAYKEASKSSISLTPAGYERMMISKVMRDYPQADEAVTKGLINEYLKVRKVI